MNAPERPARWARAIRSASIVGFLCLPVGALGTRFGAWNYKFGLLIFAAGVVVVIVTTLAGLIGVIVLKRRGVDSGALQMAPFIGLATGLLLYPNIRAGLTSPPIHQVTTNLADPPPFRAILRVRGADSNPLGLTPDVIDILREAYPWLRTAVVSLPADAAFATALQVVEDMALYIVDADAARGTIEATHTSFWFGFKDDVVIRIEPVVGGARVDMRSISRVGKSDLGMNADRVSEFFRRYAVETGDLATTR
ncbi:MAG: DUF1499 domain-containing protein [Gemmatimonadota bacterium]